MIISLIIGMIGIQMGFIPVLSPPGLVDRPGHWNGPWDNFQWTLGAAETHTSLFYAHGYYWEADEVPDSGNTAILVYRYAPGDTGPAFFGGFLSTAGDVSYPSLVVTANYLSVIYNYRTWKDGLDKLWCARSPWSSCHWQWHEIDSGRKGDSDADVFSTSSDDITVVYNHYITSSDKDIEFMKSSDGGASWYGHVIIKGTSDPSPYLRPQICQGSGSDLWVTFWNDNNGKVWFAKSTDHGDSWAADSLDNTDAMEYPSIAGYQNYAVILATRKSDHALYNFYTTDGGANWSTKGNFTDAYYPNVVRYDTSFEAALYQSSSDKAFYSTTPYSIPQALDDNLVSYLDGPYSEVDVLGVMNECYSWLDERGGIWGAGKFLEVAEERSSSFRGKILSHQNPFRKHNALIFDCPGLRFPLIDVRLYNCLGAEIKLRYEMTGENQLRLFPDEVLSSGIYLIRIEDGSKKIFRSKFVLLD